MGLVSAVLLVVPGGGFLREENDFCAGSGDDQCSKSCLWVISAGCTCGCAVHAVSDVLRCTLSAHFRVLLCTFSTEQLRHCSAV